MQIRFKENPIIPSSDSHSEIDFCTILPIGRYNIKIIHTYNGIGVSDRYSQESIIEIFLGEENVTKSILRKYAYEEELSFPIPATTKHLKNILDILYA